MSNLNSYEPELGFLLSDYLRFNKISQKEVIQRTGISKSRISKFLNGHLNIGSSDFVKILKAVNLDIEKAIEKRSLEAVVKKKKDINSLDSAVYEVLNSLDDLGRQSCLSQVLFAAKLSKNKTKISRKALSLIQDELNKI